MCNSLDIKGNCRSWKAVMGERGQGQGREERNLNLCSGFTKTPWVPPELPEAWGLL